MLQKATRFLLLAISSTAAVPAVAQQQVISTVVGTTFTFPSLPLPAVNAPLGVVYGVAVDANGNVYVVDVDNSLVMRFVPGSQMAVVAGNGFCCFSGDGGPATSASFYAPNSVAVDSAGNLYIGDAYRVRKVSDGIITTVAGNGTSGFSGDGGPAVSASLGYTTGVAVDSAGNLYIADSGNLRVRRVSGGTITTVAGNGTTGFSGDGGPATSASLSPDGLALDSAGNLYISDYANNRIRKVSGGTIATVAGNGKAGFSGDGGPATSASLNDPAGVAIDSAGNLYISDSSNKRIRKVTGTTIATVAGNGNLGFSGDGGPATSASLNMPAGVAADSAGNVYVADSGNSRIRRVSSGTIATAAGNGSYKFSGDGGPATSASLNSPSGTAVDSAGNLYIADPGNQRIRKVSSGTITTVAGNGFIEYSGDGGPATSASLSGPEGVAVDSAGNLYIADSVNNRIRKVSGGTITTVAGNGATGFSGDGGPATSASLFNPYGVAVDSAGNLYIADTNNNRVRKVSGGLITTVAGNGKEGFSGDAGLATNAALFNPYGVAVDLAGNLYISDTGNARVRKVTGGTITTVAGNGTAGFSGDGGPSTSASLNFPQGIAVDSAENLYIGDAVNYRIRKVSDGIITTVAGNGHAGFSGDGGPATNASLNTYIFAAGTASVTVDSTGNLYISDMGNDRIREVQANPPTFTVSPLTLSFTAVSEALAPPAQAVQIAGSVPNLAFTAQTSGAPWLTLSTTSGTLPYNLQVSVDPSQLAAGLYSATIVITVPAASTTPITVQVSLTVAAPATQRLSVSSQSLSFSVTQGAAPATSQLTLTDTGSGSLNFTASALAATGGNWISISPTGGTVTASSPVSLTVTANPGTLAASTYTSTITIASATTGQSITVPATLTVNVPQAKIVLSQLGFTFVAVASGGTVLQQSLGIVNGGSGSMNWTAQAVTASGSSCPWLDLSASSGSLATPLIDSSLIDLNVNAQGLALAPGSYDCLIQVSAPTASNSPQSALVVLDVLAAGVNPGPNVQPSGLVFTNVAGNENPGSQTALVANVTGVTINFGSALTYGPGASGWIQYLPLNAAVAPDQPTPIVIQPNFSGLSAGAYQATLSLNFDDGSIRSIVILAVIAPAGTTPNASGASDRTARTQPAATGCMPTTLHTIFTQLGAGPNVPAGWPATIAVEVIDDCSNPINTGSLVASFNNGDAPLPLMNMQNGQWAASWTPGVVSATGVTVMLQAMASNLSGSAQETIGLASGETQPILAGQPISAVTETPGPFAPGDLMLIQGSALADAQASSSSTHVAIGPMLASLLNVDPTRVIAQVPLGVAVNSTPQIAISRDSSVILLPVVSIAATHPAILSKDGTGQGQALIYNANPAATLADVSNPAQAGGTIVIYCSGLGGMDAKGNATNVPTVTIGGEAVNATYSGLALAASYPSTGPPTLFGVVSTGVGLYQITATVPAGLATGSAPVIISSAGQSSQSGVTMMIFGTGSTPTQPVSIAAGGVLNAASFAKNSQGLGTAVAPGSVVAIFGSFPGATAASAPSIPYTTSLGGVTVTFNGTLAPIQGVAPGGAYPFITAQVPFELQTGTAQLVVAVNGQASPPVTTPIVAAAPGIFTDPATGQGNAILVYTAANGTATVAAPVNAGLGFATAPIPRGTSAFFYATGLGALTPPVADGAGGIDGTTHEAILKPVVTIGGVATQVSYYGPSGYPGVYQINIVVPQSAPTGAVIPLVVTTPDGSVISNTATVAIM